MSQSSIRAGEQWASTECSTKVVVVRIPADVAVVISCGGEPMIPAAGARAPKAGVGTARTLVGKRYVDASGDVELLCVSAGAGELTCNGVTMQIKEAKPLPASD